MTNDNDTTKIVKEFLDLWQKQFAYNARDPEALSTTLQLFEQMQDNYFKTMKMFTQAKGPNDARSAAATGLSGNVVDELDQLYRRVARLEKRVAELEAGVDEPGSGPAKTSERQAPGRTGGGTPEAAE